MGSDGAPRVEVAGVVRALVELPDHVEVLLVGEESAIRTECSAQSLEHPRVMVHHAPDRIDGGEPPVAAVRKKPDSSIVVGVRLQSQGEADAFVSAGSTGAVMAASLFHLKRLQNVDRPAIGSVMPTATGHTLLVDAGATVDCKPHHMFQFAQLGKIYAQDLMSKEHPRIGLLNIGEEDEKGDELAIETHALLKASSLNFVGNVEGSDVIHGVCDVLVCDGFVGNVLLKFYESVASYIVQLMGTLVEGTDLEADLGALFRALDYAEYGGAPLLGVNGLSFICHGRSSSKAIANALIAAARAVDRSMVAHLAGELENATPPEVKA